jgi:cytochrome c oxidase subunit 2
MMHRASLGRVAKVLLVLAAAGLLACASSGWCSEKPSNPEKFLGMPWLTEGASSYAKDIDDLWDFIFYLTGVVFIVTEGLLVVFLIKYRKREGAKSVYTHGNHTLEMAWTIIPAIILGGIAIIQKSTWDSIKKPENFPTGKDVVHIQTFAKQFAWNFRYAGSDGKWGTDDDIVLDSKLVVPVNRPIVMEQTSLDVIHSFFLPNMRLKQDVVPGMHIKVWFMATKTSEEMRKTRGNYVKPVELKSKDELEKEKTNPTPPEPWTYEIVCAELCGIQHGEMRGTLEVLDQPAYDAWYADASDKAAGIEPPEIWNFWPVANADTGERDFKAVRKKYRALKDKEAAEREKNKEKEE